MLLSTFAWLLGTILTARGQDEDNELSLISSRRKTDLSRFPTPQAIASISSWLGSQSSNGTWADVNYLSGCTARMSHELFQVPRSRSIDPPVIERANWPIQEHWDRLIVFASAWSGLNPDIPSNWTGSSDLLQGVKNGLDWWLDNDYTSDDCIDLGGASNATCPCGTPGLWNPNWFDQIILIPQLLSTTCLLVESGLTASELSGCVRIPYRAYQRRDEYIHGVGYLTGANTINVMQNSVSMALYVGNATILDDALHRAMAVVTYSDIPAQDGIHRDGSFLQHSGILYNGNYGKDLLNAFVQLEGEVIGTSFAANETTRRAFATDVQGSEWMIYVDTQTRQEHWDLNAIGRFIGFPTVDLQASADINFNVTKLAAATADFEGEYTLNDTIRRLSSNGTDKLDGNKMFYASDYMVHRREQVILTNKMISNRSHNTEYTNSANPYGYHLGQGTLFSYVTGYEYRDIQAGWNWNLIPGTTVQRDHPKLQSSIVGVTGKTKFVGGASDGWVGTSVEDYVDPYDASLRYRKAWFFLDDSVVVTVSGISVNDTVGQDVITVLDQRMAVDGGIWIDGQSVNAGLSTTANGTTLFYGGNGYLSYDTPFQLTLSEANRTGNWSAISTSTVGNSTVPIFYAYTTHDLDFNSYSYAFFPATDRDRLVSEVANPTSTPINDNGVSGVAGQERLSVVFWPNQASSVAVNLSTVGWSKQGSITISSRDPGVYLFATRLNDDGSRTMVVTLADPSQSLNTTSFALTSHALDLRCEKLDWYDGCSQEQRSVAFTDITLPQGGFAGDSIFREVLIL
ncbi:polysaccharide lyase family 8 protein [Naematelia encephala]|uniref:Polysaccharide lyase family 8 protein n=1 Tax=Naematelia encephala TaxID=71784 RepID=A0A1Y2BDF7_9TREE|nr:polysaccharide lyase family 8 protein [Naematelia encephala]